MADEPIVSGKNAETQSQPAPTIIVTDRTASGGGGWLVGVVLLIGVIGAVLYFTQVSSSEAKRNDAITKAADNVGEAAQQVGNAAQDAADNMNKK